MEWLKKILENAKLTEDGKLNVEETMSAIQKEFPHHAVPKKEFNDKVTELKTANDTIETLKRENGENEGLQKKIKDYEVKINSLEQSARDTAKTYALKEQLSKQGVLDPDYLIYKHGGLEKFTFNKEDQPIGVQDIIKPYMEDKTMKHLFKQESHYNPLGGSEGMVSNPFAKETFNLTKQGELFRNNPEQARELAAAAGVKI